MKTQPKLSFKINSDSQDKSYLTIPIGEFAEVKGGIGFPVELQGENTTEIPFFKVSDMELAGNERELLNANNYVSLKSLSENLKCNFFDKPAVVFAKVGAALLLDRKRICRSKFLIDNNMMAVMPNTDICKLEYLYYDLLNKKLSNLSNTGALPSINAYQIKEVVVKLPCIEEQQKTAEFFTALDEKIRIQLNTVDKLNAIKTGMIAKVFSYENTLDWTVCKFDEIFAMNRTFPVSRDQISDECDQTADNSKIIHYGDILTIYGNIVNPKSDSIGYLVTDVNAKDDDYLCDGDIVFADAAEDYTVGKAIELDGVDCKLLSGLHTIAARPKITFANGYLSYFFNSPIFKNQVRTLATGTKVMSLTKSSIQTTSIFFPSIEEQQKVSNLLNTLDNKIEISKKKVNALKQLKKAFMQRMFV